jgi:hypothetical protein
VIALNDGEGLYPGGNVRPASYDALATTLTLPVKVNVIGASTAQIFYDALVTRVNDPDVRWADCAYGGKTADIWANPNAREWSTCHKNGFPDPQVVVIKTGSDTDSVATNTANLKAMATNAFNKWPTLKQVYFIDEGWLGYYAPTAAGTAGFSHGQSIKQVVTDHMNSGTRFVAWGTYLWANGLGSDQVAGGVPGRNDGTEWLVSDYGGDGLHQSAQGATKQVNMFIASLLADPVTSKWYNGQ